MPAASPSRLRSRDERKASVTAIIERLQRAVAAGPRRDRVFPAGAGHPDLDAREPRAISVHAERHRRGRGRRLGGEAGRSSCRSSPLLRDVASEAQDDGLRMQVAGRPRNRRAARHLDADCQRHAERRVRPAADLDHLRAGQPVSRHPGGEAANIRTIRRSLSKLYVPASGVQAVAQSTLVDLEFTDRSFPACTGSPMVPLSTFARFEHTTAPLVDRAPGAVPGGHHQLQSCAGCRAQRCGATDIAGRARHRHADLGDRQLFRRCRRVRQVARRRALADPRRRGHDLHRARRAVRKLHPSAHDPVDAAVGRRRRAARADAVGRTSRSSR